MVLREETRERSTGEEENEKLGGMIIF